jgi:hypothetical protein
MWRIALQAIAANAWVSVAAFGYGSWIPRFLPQTFSRFAKLACGLIGGFGLLGLTVFLVGHVSLTRWSVGAILIVGTILAAASKLRPWDLCLPVAKVPAAIVCAMLVWTAVAGLAEPVGSWDKDGVAYHLVGPKVWLRNGIIRPIADNMNTSYPDTPEMVFTALSTFGGGRAPGFSACWTIGLLLAVAAALGRRCGLDVSATWWAAALAVTMPAVYNGGFAAFVDVIYATFILAAVRVGLDATERKHFAIFGFFCGLAMATKYPALLALPVLVLCAVWKRRTVGSLRAAIPNVLAAVAVAALVSSPIYVKNWILLGTPLYPPPASIAKILHVKYFPTDAIRTFYQYNIARGRGHGRGPLHFLTLPFNLTYHTADFSGGGGIGLTPLAFGPFGLWALWREGFARRLALMGLLLSILWFVTMQESRYLIHVYTISAIFAAAGWQKATTITGRRGRLLCASIVAISLAYGIDMISHVQLPAARSVLSATQAVQWRRNNAVFIEGFDYINHTPEVEHVLILDRSVPPYYSDKDYVKPFGQWGERVYPGIETVPDVLPRLREMGITHVFDVQSTISDYRVPTDYHGLVLVFQGPGQRVYQVLPGK